MNNQSEDLLKGGEENVGNAMEEDGDWGGIHKNDYSPSHLLKPQEEKERGREGGREGDKNHPPNQLTNEGRASKQEEEPKKSEY